MINLELYTDGSCNNNPHHASHGISAWAFVLEYKGVTIKEDVGFEHPSTSGRAEMLAVLNGLKYIFKKHKNESVFLNVFSDSEYVVKAFTERRIDRWKEIDFDNIKNPEIWIKLDDLLNSTKRIKVKFNHVKGHNGHTQNERCDELATIARKEYIKFLEN